MLRALLPAVIYATVVSHFLSAQTAERGRNSLCDEVIANVVPGVNRKSTLGGLPHVEIRRCAPVGSLQLVAWQRRGKPPALTIPISRFSLGQVLMNRNVFVAVAPGPYDTVIVIQYQRGRPEEVFSDSTHENVTLTSELDRVIVRVGNTRKVFKADDDELLMPQP
jgi:hypothetical protein